MSNIFNVIESSNSYAKVMHKINTSFDTITSKIGCFHRLTQPIASTIFMSDKQNINIEIQLHPL
jgi:hypothetical protein